MPAGRGRVSMLRFSPAFVLFAIVIADARQFSDPDLWGHVLWGRELLAHGSLLATNPYSYSAPGYPWLRHEWLSEVTMAAMFNACGPWGLKLLKFACSAGTICLVTSAESESGAPAAIQAAILLVLALILTPVMQFRPQIFDFLAVSAIIALLARHNWRGSSRLWLAIPLVALWSNFHGGFFIGLVALGVYGAATVVSDMMTGNGLRRGLGVIAITAAAAASTLCTFLIAPARDTWRTLINSLMNPMTHATVADWTPLIPTLKAAAGGSIDQKYFVVVLIFFAAAAVSVMLAPKGGDAPLVAVAAVMVAAAFTAVRNVPIAAIALAPVIANHLGLLLAGRTRPAPAVAAGHPPPPALRFAIEIFIAVFALGFARYHGFLKPGIAASGYPADAVSFMNRRGLKGNVLADYAWGQYVIWHAPSDKVFIDSRYDLAYPPAVVSDYVELDRGMAGGAHTLAAYPNDFVLIKRGSPAAALLDFQRDWRLIYSDNVARLYARANSPAAQLEGVPLAGVAGPVSFP